MTDIVTKLAAALGVDMKETKPMGHLESFAEDIQELLVAVDKEFEYLNQRKLKLKEKSTEVAGRWADHFVRQHAALTAADAALSRISNVPMSEVVKKEDPSKDQTLSEAKNG